MVLSSSYRIPTASEKKKAIDVAYQFFTNERDYPLQGRRAAAERVCVTLMKSCDEVALREFFLDHVRDIMAVIEASLSKVKCMTLCESRKLQCCYGYLYSPQWSHSWCAKFVVSTLWKFFTSAYPLEHLVV